MKRLIRRTTQRLLGRRPRCDKGRISQPQFLDQDTYLEMCVLEAHHEGDHELGPREPSGASAEVQDVHDRAREQAHIHNVISRFEAFERIPQPDMLAEWLRDNPDPADAATELTRHDQDHGHCQEDQ